MNDKNILVASEGRPYRAVLALQLQRTPVTTIRMFSKVLGSRRMSWQSQVASRLLLFLVGHFQIDVTFLSTKLQRIFEVAIGYAEKHNQLLLSKTW